MPKYLVETLSQFRVVYIVETNNRNKDSVESAVHMGEVHEYGQMHLGEMIISSREVDDAEIILVNDELNEYLIDLSAEKKLSRVYKMDENDED